MVSKKSCPTALLPWGGVHEASDIDLILVGNFEAPFLGRAEVVLSLTKLPAEVLCYTPEEFDEMIARDNPFLTTVLEEAIEL